jgi:hypothetical protein
MTTKSSMAPRTEIWTAGEALNWIGYGDEATYHAARQGLRDAIAKGKVVAHGFRVNPNQPPLAREKLPSDLFDQFSRLAVDVFGETTMMHPAAPQNIPQWNGIVFDNKEIRASWPKAAPTLDQWMISDAAAHPDKKRDSRIDDCREANDCTVRAAKAAYARLPNNFKRGRGRKIRTPASSK